MTSICLSHRAILIWIKWTVLSRHDCFTSQRPGQVAPGASCGGIQRQRRELPAAQSAATNERKKVADRMDMAMLRLRMGITEYREAYFSHLTIKATGHINYLAVNVPRPLYYSGILSPCQVNISRNASKPIASISFESGKRSVPG